MDLKIGFKVPTENPDGLSWFIMVYHNCPDYLIEMTILEPSFYREAHGLVPLCLLWCPSPACPRPRPRYSA